MSDSPANEAPRETSNAVKGMCFGMIFGVALGILYGVAVGNMALMSVGIGAGMCIGLAIGTSMDRREAEDRERALALKSDEECGGDR